MRVGSLRFEIEDAQDDDEIRVWADGYRIIATRERGLRMVAKVERPRVYGVPMRGRIKRDYVASPSTANRFDVVDPVPQLILHRVDHERSEVWVWNDGHIECRVVPLCTNIHGWYVGDPNRRSSAALLASVPDGFRVCYICQLREDDANGR